MRLLDWVGIVAGVVLPARCGTGDQGDGSREQFLRVNWRSMAARVAERASSDRYREPAAVVLVTRGRDVCGDVVARVSVCPVGFVAAAGRFGRCGPRRAVGECCLLSAVVRLVLAGKRNEPADRCICVVRAVELQPAQEYVLYYLTSVGDVMPGALAGMRHEKVAGIGSVGRHDQSGPAPSGHSCCV